LPITTQYQLVIIQFKVLTGLDNPTEPETAMYVASRDKQRPELGVIFTPVMKNAVKNFDESKRQIHHNKD